MALLCYVLLRNAVIQGTTMQKGKVTPLQARCGPECG